MIQIVIPIQTDNAARAEALVDWVFQLNGREQRGHVLLVFYSVHEEFRARIKIAADLAFESVEEFIPPSKDTPQKMLSAVARRNNVFLTAAEHCQKTFRCAWLWLEPESTPTNPQWLSKIEDAYDNQTRRYLMTHLRPSEDSKDRFPFAVGVWHMGAFNDISKLCVDNPEVPFEHVSGMTVVSRSTKSRLFQPLKIQSESDFDKVWPEAQIVVGDVSGALIEFYREKGIHFPKQPTVEEKSRILDFYGTAPDELLKTAANFLPAISAKPDLRTKEGRAWKAAHANGNGH